MFGAWFVRLLVALALALAALQAASPALTAYCAPQSQAAKPRPASITVVMDDNYPPFIFRSSSGELQGVLVDQWKQWSEATGVAVNLVATDWDKAQQIMAEGRADVIDTMFETEARSRVYDFTPAYFQLDVPVFYHKTLSGITNLDSLQGFTIGVKAGDACVDVLRGRGITSVKEFSSYEDVIKAARDGVVKVFCVDKPPALYYLYKYNLDDDFLFGFTLYSGEFHRAVKKGREDLLNLVESGFERIPRAELEAINHKWMGVPLYNSRVRSMIRYAMAAVAVCLGILGGFNVVLRRRVRAKTRELSDLLEALRMSDERWQFALEGAGAGVWDWNVATGKVFFSDRWKSMLGFAPHELRDNFEQWRELLHPEDLEHAERTVQRYLSGVSSSYVLEHRLRCKDGRYRWILAVGKVMERDPAGAPLRMIGTHTDISARKDAEESLRRALTFNEMILEHSPVGVLLYDGAGGACVMASRAAADLLGVSKAELLGRTLHSVEVWNAADPASPAGRALAGEGLQRADLRLRRTEEGRGKAECTFCRIEVAGAPYLLVIAVDIDERVRMYTMMAETEKMMSVGGLAAGMAHEINNPLAGILQSAQNLRRRLEAGIRANENAAAEAGCGLDAIRDYCSRRRVFELLDAVREAGEKAASIVANMLEFSRKPGAGHLPVDIGVLLDKALELCANDYDMKKKYDFRKVEIVREYAQGMPHVPCSPTQIEQVAMNILRNAAQALTLRRGTPDERPPRIVLRTAVEAGMARIDITDNGPGMEPALLGKVFEPFFTTKEVGEGTGLGLSVSYFIVTSNHGGSIQASSTPGEGTTFTIRLPLGAQGREAAA
nr:transporter substrate-binding domain-containing protein [Fundidesulfovibrio agrisoli]